MITNLNSTQFKTISEFCNDIAKGVMLAVVIGQGVLPTFLGIARVAMSIFWILVSLFFLYFALIFGQETKR